ncbi:S8 family serine peptidase [Winogradskyella sp.]|uniref:S8 family serine peptidase n=1 Tax=Winogradskyella sp. TaxID=1883156 RepID=UPI0026016112|nr:S8 family serine peptidase [Winogradskyella sp.]
MKKLLLSLFFLCAIYNTHSQASSNMSEENKDLLNYLNEKELNRKNQVKIFLQNNANVPEFIYKDGEIQSYLWKIIDGKPIYRSQDNVAAARATKTNQLMPGGSSNLNLDGSGITVGVWEVNIPQAGHVEFLDNGGASRVTMFDFVNQNGTTNETNHATHVIGTIAARGDNPSAQGMAINSLIKSYNSGNDEAEMLLEASDATSPLLLSNHSYGPIFDNLVPDFNWILGAYITDTRDIDEIARNNPFYLSVWSAGNDGNRANPEPLFDGFDKLYFTTCAKNNLVIANADPSAIEQPLFSGNYELINLEISDTSTEGPTDDLRIKPDLAADGTNLESSIPVNAYGISSGTSMSAPNTTGTLALLQQYYNQLHGNYMLAATLKGLVCHTAIDDNDTIGPDPIFGWGFLNARASADAITDANNREAVIEELTLDQGVEYSFTFSAQAGDKLSATICWTDMPGTAVTDESGLNDQTPRLVNDLDLRLSKDGTTYFPWRLDYSMVSGFSNSKGDNIRDNVERIDIEAPTSGMYTLTVSNKGILQGNGSGGPFNQSQDFSLIITGNNVALSVDDNDLARRLTMYPNPSKGEFTINFESNLNNNNDIKIDVYDIQGRLVFNNSYKNISPIFEETISLDDAKSGVYIVNISDGNNKTSHKLVVE